MSEHDSIDDRIITAKDIHSKVVGLGWEVDRLVLEVREANRRISGANAILGMIAALVYLTRKGRA